VSPTADYNLGTARGKIEVGYDGKGIAQANKGLDTFQSKAQKLGSGFSKVATLTGAGAGIIAAGIGLAVKSAISFEKQISAIGAVSGASAKEMEALRAKALQLGADTAFSASESAQAMEELVKSGLSVSDVLNGAADATVALAAAGGIALPEAATIASNAMNQFGLTAQQMPHIADLIAGAANSSAIDVHDFGMSIQQAGAVANLVGVSFEDMSAAIALMGNAGIKGSDAGTSLKTMLLNLNPQTKKQTDLMKKLGIITSDGANRFFDAKGKLKGFGDVAQILQDSLKGMTKAQQLATLETIFGSDAIRAAAILTKEGAKGFDEMAASMGQITAKDVAAKRLDNVAGSLEQLRGSVETAAIAFGTAFLPVIRTVAKFITQLANRFSALDPRWQKLIAFAIAGVGALLAVVAAIAALGAMILGVAASLVAVKIAVVIGGIVAAVGLLVAGFVALWKHSQSFREAVQSAFKVVKIVVANAIANFKALVSFIQTTLLPIIREGIRKAIENLQPAFVAIKGWIDNTLLPAMAQLNDAFQKALPTIKTVAEFLVKLFAKNLEVLGKVLGTLIPILINLVGPPFKLFIAVLSFLISHIPQVVDAIKSFVNILITIGKIVALTVIVPLMALWEAAKAVFNGIKIAVQAFVDFFKGVWSAISAPVLAVFGVIKSIISLAMTAIQAIVAVAWTVIRAVFNAAMGPIRAVVEAGFNAIRSVVTAVMGFLSPYLRAIWGVIQAAISVAVNAARAVVSSAWNTIRSVTSTVFNAIRGIVSTVWSAIQSITSGAVSKIVSIANGIKALVDRVRGFFNELRTAASGGTDSLIAFVRGIPGRILSAVGNLGGLLINAGRNLISGLINGIQQMIGSLVSKLSSVTNLIAQVKGPEERDKKLLTPAGKWIMEGLIRGIEERLPALLGRLGDITDMVGNPTLVQNAVVTASTTSAGIALPPGPQPPAADKRGTVPWSIQNLNIRGVWDFTDPTAARKMVATLHKELDKFEKEHAS
jgi:TP901 family phage tail tape measure protein